MAAFTKLEDSPMFRKQMYSLEQLADELKRRCQKLHKGCQNFMGSLDVAYEGDLAFADSLQEFGAGQDDPISVAIGGPVMSKFVTAFRELSTYKELLRTQIEHMLSERLMQFMNVDLQNVKDSRKRLDKAAIGYDQAREKFVSAKKGTRTDAELEEDLENSKSTFEKCRFNLVSVVTSVEAKKKYEFLESISAVMDAHMRYFKQGYELLQQLEPFVLTYAQQTKELASNEHEKLETRIHEFRTQAELANLKPVSNTDNSTSGDGIHVVGVHSYKKIEELMQSSSNGEVQIIKQGYLLKRSKSSRGEWKRKFFVLDSHGMLYYYSNKLNKQSQGSTLQQSRFNFLNQRTPYQGEEATLGYHTIDLQTSTLKLDAEQKDLRFCFRIISPAKSYTLQGENKADQMDWIEKITGVIASILHSTFPRQISSRNSDKENNGIESVSLEEQQQGYDNVLSDLRSIPGNEICAECSAPEPDWASLNLGILMCIECSGVHRNLGVHISKVRSLRLDVRVWEPVMCNLFHALGNTYANSIWEGSLLNQDESNDRSKEGSAPIEKPNPSDTIVTKEKYIQTKYVEKHFIAKEPESKSVTIWDAIKSNDIKTAYRLIVADNINPNMRYYEPDDNCHNQAESTVELRQFDPLACQRIASSDQQDSCMEGCSPLHFACHFADPTMIELFLQFGSFIDLQDFHGRTPLHHCVFKKNDAVAKYLLKRGARASIKDGGNLTAFERRMEIGAITDEELLILFAG
ncbi:ADP-ribosylation factor GTPase-activating protein AGD4-like protein [Carex littledalei]|uniref:ADP-ribosylation factor GTPase-activating protein AGD4-like protein n=1 Tax=Carex littledalei TaxID=544730 RepID=A0A833VP73_9POAL|nr:ADP-ribosylation factor GTPase-activating protein AGD4-like protein [Carex littledalei]